MPQPLLQTQNLSIAFGDKTAVHDVCLQIQAGEKLALVGESGSGKSVTALALMGLLDQAQVSGSVQLLGAELHSLSPGRCELVIPITDAVRQQHGFVHGGVVSEPRKV